MHMTSLSDARPADTTEPEPLGWLAILAAAGGLLLCATHFGSSSLASDLVLDLVAGVATCGLLLFYTSPEQGH